MDKDYLIKQKVDATLDSLNDLQPAEPGPFFYTRVLASLHRSSPRKWEKISAFVARPAVAFSVICLVVLINTLAVYQQTESAPAFSGQTEETLYDEESNLAALHSYDYENEEP